MDVLTDLEKQVKDMSNELENLPEDENGRNLQDNFKLLAYRLTLKRILLNISLLEKIENKLKEIDLNGKKIKDITDLHKSLTKSLDSLATQMRSFYPSRISNNEKEIDEKFKDNELSQRSVVEMMIMNLIKDLTKLRNDMNNYDVTSIEYWKMVNSYTNLMEKLDSFLVKLRQIKEEDPDKNKRLTLEEVKEAYNDFKYMTKKEQKKVMDKWNSQQEKIKEKV